jgi:YaaC-like Protein
MHHQIEQIEQGLVAFESVDVVRKWHKQIRQRNLSLRRAAEVAAAARQAREYFRNAANSAYSVRPLLTYYGNASLARAVTLLLRTRSGEESLGRGHGLETVKWSQTLGSDISKSIPLIGHLRVRPTASGLFRDFLREIKNAICVHVNWSAVEWRVSYPEPATNSELAVTDLISRLPDLEAGRRSDVQSMFLAPIAKMSYSQESGFVATFQGQPSDIIFADYLSAGYTVATVDHGLVELRCNAAQFQIALPQLVHSYVRKTFGSIPSLHLASPFPGGNKLSQLAITFALSYVLGMLTRYYPSHWVALQSGATGDGMWPQIFAAQRYAELVFPELVLEFVEYELSNTSEHVSGVIVQPLSR